MQPQSLPPQPQSMPPQLNLQPLGNRVVDANWTHPQQESTNSMLRNVIVDIDCEYHTYKANCLCHGMLL